MSEEKKRFLQSDMTLEDWERFAAYIENKRREVERKKGNLYVVDLIGLLWPHNVRGLSRAEAIAGIHDLRIRNGLTIASSFPETVQSAFNHHNRDSVVCKQKQNAPFYTVSRGVWGLNRQRAFAWLEAQD